jgi:Na+-translocating ferredoxin:NAD+ oxidoreductase RNF subunit RnfB
MQASNGVVPIHIRSSSTPMNRLCVCYVFVVTPLANRLQVVYHDLEASCGLCVYVCDVRVVCALIVFFA